MTSYQPDPQQQNTETPPTGAARITPSPERVRQQQDAALDSLPRSINVKRAVRRQAAPLEDEHRLAQSPAVPGVSEVKDVSPLVHPTLPPQSAAVPPAAANANKTRLKSFTSNGVDYLPTTTLPVLDNNTLRPHTQQTDPPNLVVGPREQNPATVQAVNAAQQNVLPVTPPQGVHVLPAHPVRTLSGGEALSPGQAIMTGNEGSETSGMVRQTVATQSQQVVGTHVILHRAANFFVATVSRPGTPPPSLRRRSGQTTILPAFAPQQQQRIAASETRMMPKVGPINPVQSRSISLPYRLEAIVVMLGLIGAGIAHAFNMFNYPQYGLDEGTYMASAWAIVHGMLFPYPYGYGHPPLGWIQIAAWVQLTGGFFTFGNATNTGRVLMMLYALGSTLLVYLIVRRLDGSRVAALLAMIIFSLSPLSIAYQRLVLLDNIATFWFLLSIYFIVVSNSRLLFIILAAIAFGCSILSKEVMLLFFPVMVYAVWLHTTKFQRKFALVAFIYSFVAIGSTFILMAILRGELLPPISWLPWDSHPHLSLFSTYLQQVQRSQAQGNLLDSIAIWNQQDVLFVVLAIVTTLFNLLVGWWKRKSLLLALLALSFWILFLRNGIIFPFYIIPLLPLSAFNAAVAINTLMRWLVRLTRFDVVRVLLIFAIIGGIGVYDAQHSALIFTENLSFVQSNALTWVRDNVPHNAVVVINSYFYTDLHEAGGEGVGNGTTFQHADIYWNMAYDPELHDGLLNNNWDNIDFIITDAPMKYDIQHLGGDMNLINLALQHSFLRADFRPSQYDWQDAIQIYQVIHKNASAITSSSFVEGREPLWSPVSLSTPSAFVKLGYLMLGDKKDWINYGSNTTRYGYYCHHAHI
jgi:Dolichyl-phosphate-mannose-protein mannosyltransferase